MAVGDAGESFDENGFLRGGTGGAGPAFPLNAFFSEANEPFRGARKPAEDEIDVPGVMSDDDEPLLNLPSFARGSSAPPELFGPTLKLWATLVKPGRDGVPFKREGYS